MMVLIEKCREGHALRQYLGHERRSRDEGVAMGWNWPGAKPNRSLVPLP